MRALPEPQSGSRDRPGTAIAPSILSSDFARLAEECKSMVDQGADWLHVDVMDGHFCPNLTLGAPIVTSLRKHTDAFLDCHLMVTDPAFWVDAFAKAGADMYTFHFEAAADGKEGEAGVSAVKHVCTAVRAAGMRAGIALKPKTPVEAVVPLIDAGLVDMVLVMTVEPGFGGQSCIMEMFDKVRTLRGKYPNLLIEVDGGISPGTTVDAAAAAGANVIVAGSAVFGAASPRDAITALREAVDKAAVRTVAAH